MMFSRSVRGLPVVTLSLTFAHRGMAVARNINMICSHRQYCWSLTADVLRISRFNVRHNATASNHIHTWRNSNRCITHAVTQNNNDRGIPMATIPTMNPTKLTQRGFASKVPAHMAAWQIFEYGGTENLTLTKDCSLPPILAPNEILVEVHASSVNPVDVKLLGGYGSTVINIMRKKKNYLKNGSEFPWVPGRDFSGIIVGKGRGVSKSKFNIGDEVWGTVDSPNLRGPHAQYTAQPSNCITRKPPTLSHVEAASIPYVACTAWAALCTMGGLSSSNTPGKRILVLGGSGGVGTFAIQLLKAWGAEVTTTCSGSASDLVASLGADIIVDYKTSNMKEELNKMKGFDLVFDCVGGESHSFGPTLIKLGGTFVTISHPTLSNVDKHGLLPGLAKTGASYLTKFAAGMIKGQNIKWAVYMPSTKCLETCFQLVEQNKLVPVLDKVFPFSETPAAYAKVSSPGNRGKTVVDVKDMSAC